MLKPLTIKHELASNVLTSTSKSRHSRYETAKHTPVEQQVSEIRRKQLNDIKFHRSHDIGRKKAKTPDLNGMRPTLVTSNE